MSARRPPKDWKLVVGGLYRDREDHNFMVLVRSEPHAPRHPALIATASTDDGGERWFNGLQAWRPIQENCELVDDLHPSRPAADVESG